MNILQAVEQNNILSVEKLLENPNSLENIEDAFLTASRNNLVGIVNLFLKNTKIDFLCYCNVKGIQYINLALITACNKENIKLIELLLTDPRIDPSDGHNLAIRYASERGNLKIVKMLLEHPKTDISTIYSDLVQITFRYGKHEVLEFFLDTFGSKDNYSIDNMRIPVIEKIYKLDELDRPLNFKNMTKRIIKLSNLNVSDIIKTVESFGGTNQYTSDLIKNSSEANKIINLILKVKNTLREMGQENIENILNRSGINEMFNKIHTMIKNSPDSDFSIEILSKIFLKLKESFNEIDLSEILESFDGFSIPDIKEHILELNINHIISWFKETNQDINVTYMLVSLKKMNIFNLSNLIVQMIDGLSNLDDNTIYGLVYHIYKYISKMGISIYAEKHILKRTPHPNNFNETISNMIGFYHTLTFQDIIDKFQGISRNSLKDLITNRTHFNEENHYKLMSKMIEIQHSKSINPEIFNLCKSLLPESFEHTLFRAFRYNCEKSIRLIKTYEKLNYSMNVVMQNFGLDQKERLSNDYLPYVYGIYTLVYEKKFKKWKKRHLFFIKLRVILGHISEDFPLDILWGISEF